MAKMRTNGGADAWKDASVEFFSDDEGGINLASVADLKFLPRVGDAVMLPGPDKDSESALYEVVAVNHNFCKEMAGSLGPSQARLLSINVHAKRAEA